MRGPRDLDIDRPVRHDQKSTPILFLDNSLKDQGHSGNEMQNLFRSISGEHLGLGFPNMKLVGDDQ